MSFSKIWWNLNDRDRFGFIERNFPIRNADGDLVENWAMTEKHKDWFRNGVTFIQDKSKLRNRIHLKHRGSGATLIMIALESLIGVQLYPQVFVPTAAGTEKQSMLPIRYTKQLIKECKYDIPLYKPIQNFPDSYIKFKDGAEIQSFAGGNPKAVHGRRALWGYLDEFALARYQKELKEAFNYFFTEGGCLSYLSTPYGKNNDFWQTLQDPDSRFYRLDILLFKKMKDFDVTKPLQQQLYLGLESPWLNMAKLEQDRLDDAKNDYATFRQNMCGDPLDEITSWFPEVLIMSVVNKDLERTSRQEGDKWIGSLDVAAIVNQSAIVAGKVLIKDDKPLLSVRNIETFQGEFTYQKNKVALDINSMKYDYYVVDETGLGGINWCTELRQKCPEIPILGISYQKKDWLNSNKSNKEVMFTIAKEMMQNNQVEIPNVDILKEQLNRVERKIYANNTQFSGKQGGQFDDDVACAFVQLCLLFYKMYARNTELATEIKSMNVYPREIKQVHQHHRKRKLKYKKKMRFL